MALLTIGVVVLAFQFQMSAEARVIVILVMFIIDLLYCMLLAMVYDFDFFDKESYYE